MPPKVSQMPGPGIQHPPTKMKEIDTKSTTNIFPGHPLMYCNPHPDWMLILVNQQLFKIYVVDMAIVGNPLDIPSDNMGDGWAIHGKFAYIGARLSSTGKAGLVKVDIEEWKVVAEVQIALPDELPEKREYVDNPPKVVLIDGARNRLFVGMWQGGIAVFDLETFTQNENLLLKNSMFADRPVPARPMDGAVDGDRMYIVGTRGGKPAVACYDLAADTVQMLEVAIPPPEPPMLHCTRGAYLGGCVYLVSDAFNMGGEPTSFVGRVRVNHENFGASDVQMVSLQGHGFCRAVADKANNAVLFFEQSPGKKAYRMTNSAADISAEHELVDIPFEGNEVVFDILFDGPAMILVQQGKLVVVRRPLH